MSPEFSLKEHVKEEHKRSPFNTYIKEIVYGGNDGIVTTFAVVAGFNGAQSGSDIASYGTSIVLLFGLSNLFADAASMGLGNFLSMRAEKDVYNFEKQKELHEIKNNKGLEMGETKMILQQKGFTSDQADQLTRIYSTNPSYWVSFMMNHELELANPEGENSYLTGLATFVSFAIFGAIPLLAYLLNVSVDRAFIFSTFSTFLALILLGVLKWRVVGKNPIRSIGEVVLIGGTSALIAYFVGTFFRI